MANLPGPAIELVALHLTRSWLSCPDPTLTQHHDPRRHVLPLVCKSWRDAVALADRELWQEVSIITTDLFPITGGSGSRGGSQADASGTVAEDNPAFCIAARHKPGLGAGDWLRCWFEARASWVQSLCIKLRWSPAWCSCMHLEDTLAHVLISCRGSLRRLHLEVQGAELLTCHIWPWMTVQTGPGCPIFPHLQHLTLVSEGDPHGMAGCSQAANALVVASALQLVGCNTGLQHVCLQLRGIKLCGLPDGLGRLPQLHSLHIKYDPQVETLPLPTTSGFRDALPPTLRQLRLEWPPLTSAAAMQLASKLPLLQHFEATMARDAA